MKEIKFRAWDKRHKEIEYINLYWFEERGITEIDDADNVEGIYSKYVIMQFTGLHDRNGKEIYEGDILSVRDYDGQRRWSVAYCGNLNECLGMPLCGWYLQRDNFESWMELECKSEDYEVIGNIYENPERKT